MMMKLSFLLLFSLLITAKFVDNQKERGELCYVPGL